MAPLTHLLASWTIAAHTSDNARDCRLITLAGIIPDADGLGLIVDLATEAAGLKPTQFYPRYHHYLLHGIFGAVLIALLLSAFAQKRGRVLLFSFLVVHLHILCDFVGSRGPSPVDLWPIFYLGPFDHVPMWIWKGQWRLDAWPNRLITLVLFAYAIWFPLRHRHSVVGVFNRRADTGFVTILRNWKSQIIARLTRAPG